MIQIWEVRHNRGTITVKNMESRAEAVIHLQDTPTTYPHIIAFDDASKLLDRCSLTETAGWEFEYVFYGRITESVCLTFDKGDVFIHPERDGFEVRIYPDEGGIRFRNVIVKHLATPERCEEYIRQRDAGVVV